jgi:hypothetical protein
MKTNRFWIEIVALGIVIACGLALLIATFGAAAAAVAGHPEAGQAGEPSAAPPSSSLAASPDSSALPAPSPDSSAASAQLQTHEGMVTDSHCGAKHSARLGETAEVCVRECVRGGAKFSLVDGDTTYMLDGDLMLLKKVAGQRARIAGEVQGNTIKVTSVGAAI